MDFRQLRYFQAIVEEGSFSRAASRLNIAQPALSLHVRRMEEDIGAPLLLRGPHGVTPTEAGEVLARRAAALLADLAQTREELRSLGHEPTGTVRLGLPGTISNLISVPVIAGSQAQFPKIKIIVAEAMSGYVREWLLDGRIELAVVYTELRDAGVRSEPLLHEDLVVFAPAGTDADLDAQTLLAKMPLILPTGSHGLRKMLDDRLRGMDIPVDPAIEVDSFANIKRLVRDGYGCSVLPLHAVQAEAAEGAVTLHPFGGAGLRRTVYLAYSTSRPLGRAAAAIGALLRELAVDMVQKGQWAGAELAE
ncbi:LysR family transcriptional regulator [Donghicola tyrosinivorans]|uniref:LysR family nitrogen assimilation transcriptional regulator n=1 Tax=Donghicola tyrosinivorans TaxID=1652492 RepID=A0A2T0WEF0_9RHOB|nr:LysR family transcriptional regulator [Donghicola tyrosinivorans]PRY85071.1 LysR family nitrogen assimilation transcriptional regulator [Donghicola tyrosinivorans]